MDSTKDPVFQETSEFLADLAGAIARAKKRIWIQVMIFEITPEIEKYTTLLADAAKRGVDVWIIVDWITQRYYDNDLDTLITFKPSHIKKRQMVDKMAQEIFVRLQKKGVRVVIDKKPGIFGKHI